MSCSVIVHPQRIYIPVQGKTRLSNYIINVFTPDLPVLAGKFENQILEWIQKISWTVPLRTKVKMKRALRLPYQAQIFKSIENILYQLIEIWDNNLYFGCLINFYGRKTYIVKLYNKDDLYGSGLLSVVYY